MAAEPLLDVVLDQRGGASFDEVAPVAGTEPDGGARKGWPRLQVEQPPHVVGVQMGADDVGDQIPLDPQGPEADGKLTTEQAAGVVLVAGGRLGRPHPGVDQDAPVPATDQETADREPRLAATVEQVAVALGRGVVTEVARAGDEGPVGDGAEHDVADFHGPRSQGSSDRVRRAIEAMEASGRRPLGAPQRPVDGLTTVRGSYPARACASRVTGGGADSPPSDSRSSHDGAAGHRRWPGRHETPR